jgi:hypothetical protein
MNRPVVYKPLPKFGHKGDSFRAVIDAWETMGLCMVRSSPDHCCWWGEPGKVLLWDHDLLTDHTIPEHDFALYANTVPDDRQKSSPWIMWPRHPVLFEKWRGKNLKPIPPAFRLFKSTFVGKVENQLQLNNRFASDINWWDNVTNFQVVKGAATQYPYSSEMYNYVMARSRFAILLPGYGPKCNRDVEACGLGCVPVVTPGVDVKNYYRPWEENVHYVTLESTEDFDKIYSLDKDHLQDIQTNVLDWYEKNATIQGIFDTTKEIIDEHYNS